MDAEELQGHHHFSPELVIKKPNQIKHVSTEGDIIHDGTRFRGSEYLVWLVITQWIGSPSVDKRAIWFFLSLNFEDIWREVVVSFSPHSHTVSYVGRVYSHLVDCPTQLICTWIFICCVP